VNAPASSVSARAVMAIAIAQRRCRKRKQNKRDGLHPLSEDLILVLFFSLEFFLVYYTIIFKDKHKNNGRL